jgi:hypothetical protein
MRIIFQMVEKLILKKHATQEGDKMRNKIYVLFVILASVVLALAVVPPGLAQASLAEPNVSLPTGWSLGEQTAYPGILWEHDPQGAGYVEYADSATPATVLIYYENSTGITYSNNELKSEAERVFTRDIGTPFSDSGVMTVAGVSAGYVKVYNSTNDDYALQLIFVKSNYYLDVYAIYGSTSESQVMSIINSIYVTGQTSWGELGSWLIYVIIAIVAVVVIVGAAILIRKRGKKSPPQVPPPNYPPPPWFAVEI